MKVITILEKLQKYRDDYIKEYGYEPHFAPSLSSDFALCRDLRNHCVTGDVTYASPIVHIKNTSFLKFARIILKEHG